MMEMIVIDRGHRNEASCDVADANSSYLDILQSSDC